MITIKRVTAALAMLAASASFAAGLEYEVTFHNEAPIKLALPPAGNEVKLHSLKSNSKEAEPKGSVSLREENATLIIKFEWWQGDYDELTSGNGNRLTVPTGTCRKIVTVPSPADKLVAIPCRSNKHPFASFDAVTIRRLN
jgi:hypothetical protein